ncbi:MAG: polysaccharide biosynthesis tyrosine autokinase [Gammaproteobacteria bacterium]
MDHTSGLSLKQILRAMRLRWGWAVVTTLLLFSGLAAFIFSLQPAYTAEAVVLLAPQAQELQDQNKPTPSTTDPFFVRSETAILSGDALSRTVIDQLELTSLPDFQTRPGLREKLGIPAAKQNAFLSPEEARQDTALRKYQQNLSVFNDGRSKTVQVDFTASDPRLAAQIANTHAEAYLRLQSSRSKGVERESLDWLSREVDARAEAVRKAEAAVQVYQLEHNIVTTRDSTLVEERLSQLSTQLVEAQRQLSTQTTLLAELRQLRSGADASTLAAIASNESLKNLLQARIEAESNLAMLEKRFAPRHPTLVKAQQSLASLNEVLKKQALQVENEASSSASWWQRQVQDLTNAVRSGISSKTDQDHAQAGLPALVAEAQVKRTVFETVLNRYQTLLAESASSAPAASIVSRALPPALASFPRTGLFLALAAMASLFGGACFALLIQLLRPGSSDLTTMADAIGIRPLVAVPRVRRTSRSRDVITMKDPRLYVESLRFLRDALLERQQPNRCMVCLITSILPKQGKTLIGMSVARAMARVGRKTLFLEADLRRPTGSALARVAPPASGIAAVLNGRASVSDVLLADANTGLHMLLAEAHAHHALDRLTSFAMRDLLTRLRDEYDVIVIDSPPVGLVSDALALTGQADQTLLIAKDGDASIDDLKRGARLLKERGGTIAGLVLTSVDPKGLSSVDRRTLHRYVMGIPPALDSSPPEPRSPPTAVLKTKPARRRRTERS